MSVSMFRKSLFQQNFIYFSEQQKFLLPPWLPQNFFPQKRFNFFDPQRFFPLKKTNISKNRKNLLNRLKIILQTLSSSKVVYKPSKDVLAGWVGNTVKVI